MDLAPRWSPLRWHLKLLAHLQQATLIDERSCVLQEGYVNSFLASVYDSAPFFGGRRHANLELYTKPYLDRLCSTDNILEIGCGTGSLAIQLARTGRNLECIDISAQMLEVMHTKLSFEEHAVARRVRTVLGNALNYDSAILFDSIIMTDGVLLALADQNRQRDLLSKSNSLLRLGGQVLIDFSKPRHDVIARGSVTEITRFRTPSRKPYLLQVEMINEARSQVQTWNATFAECSGEPNASRVNVKVQFRYLYESEVKLLLEVCGFDLVEFDESYANGDGIFLVAKKVREFL